MTDVSRKPNYNHWEHIHDLIALAYAVGFFLFAFGLGAGFMWMIR